MVIILYLRKDRSRLLDQICFIQHDEIRNLLCPDTLQDFDVLFRHADRSIDHQNSNVRFVQHLIGLLDPELTQSPLVVKPRRVNDNNGA